VARNFEGESLTQEESERGLASISRSVIHTTLEQGEGLISPNAQEDPRFANKESVVLQDPRSIMCTPLRWRGMVIGAISEDNRVRSGIFTPPDL
jgi:GAF domain-containing protein